MFEGYLELGGGEVLNNARAKGYTDTSKCGAAWLVCQPCDGLRDVLNDDPYFYETIHEAPWYDVEDEPTHRFLGAYGLKIEGLPDSTREADVAEGIMDGGVVGRVRRGTRRMRVEAMLTAIGEDALEVGFSWLDSALSPGKCGTHGDACGAADARVFTACPPTEASITKPEVIWNDPVTNLALNPSMEAVGAPTVVRTNLATNPSFEATTAATVEVYKNYATDPRATAAATGAGAVGWTTSRWFGAPPAAGTHSFITNGVGPIPGITTYVRKTWTVAPGGNGDTGFNHNGGGTSGIPVLPGEVWTGSSYLRSSVGSKVAQAWFQFYDAAGAALGGRVAAPSVTLSAGVWTRLSHTVTTPANAAFMTFYSDITGGGTPWAAGEMLDGTALLIEKALILGEYFDGAKAPAGDFVYSWTGTANASTSVTTGIAPPTVTGSSSSHSNVVSTAWASSGTKSVRIIPKSSGFDTAAELSGMPFAANPGKVYTIMAKIRLEAPQTGTLSNNARRMWTNFNGVANLSAQAPNVAGVHEIRWTITAPPSGATQFRLYNGASAGGGDVWWDDLLIVEGEYTGPYFDGTVPAAVRRNMHPSPRPTAATWGTAAQATYTATDFPADGPDGGPFRRWDIVGGWSGGVYVYSQDHAVIAAGEEYVTSIYVRSNTTAVIANNTVPYSSTGQYQGGEQFAEVTLSPGVWTRIPLVMTAIPATATRLQVRARVQTIGLALALDVAMAMVEKGNVVGEFFDGSTPIAPAAAAWEGAVNDSPSYLYDADFTYAWSGTAHASTSTQSALPVVGRQGVAPARVIQSSSRATDRAKSGRTLALGAVLNDTALFYPVTEYSVPPGSYTFEMDVYVPTGSPPVKLHMQAPGGGPITYSPVSTLFDQWERLRVTGTASAAGTLFTRVRNVGAAPVGANWWFDREMLVLGESIAYFDGATPDSDNMDDVGAYVNGYEWTGAADASTSVHATGNVVATPDPIGYEKTLSRMVRNLHTVTCVSGPTVVQKMHRGNTWGYLVEFVLVAAVPFMFGDTKPVNLSPSSPIVIQDVPFNLVPFPSAELAAGTVVATTNYVTNPSVEVDTGGWQVDTDGVQIPFAQIALTRTNELASAGAHSAKSTFTATASGAGGWFGSGQLVALPGITPTTRYSANLWMSASVQSGTAVLGVIAAYIYWQDSGGNTLRVDEIGTEPASGGALSKKSILPPPGANRAFINARVNVTSWSAGAIIRFYADALAVTVP